MSLTEKERFYKYLQRAGQNEGIFPKIDEAKETYLEEVRGQPSTVAYSPALLRGILNGGEYRAIKKECIRIFAENMLEYSMDAQEGKPGTGMEIPEFIYNF